MRLSPPLMIILTFPPFIIILSFFHFVSFSCLLFITSCFPGSLDVIHTDDTNSSLSLYKKGSSSAVGDVDFYPNGGLSQPGCNIEDLDELVKKMVSEGLRTFLSCSHYRAIDYYLESITDRSKCLHMGYECQSYEEFLKGVCGHCHDDTHLCSEMGFRSNLYFNQMIKTERSNPIKLYFSTSRKKPFCRE